MVASALPQLSSAIRAALLARADAPPPTVHRLQVGLARLVLGHTPPTAAGQLDTASAFIEGQAGANELREARQDCWAQVGSLACGCSLSDSAAAHAILSCLEEEESAHGHPALVEQVVKVVACGASEEAVLKVLGSCVLHQPLTAGASRSMPRS